MMKLQHSSALAAVVTVTAILAASSIVVVAQFPGGSQMGSGSNPFHMGSGSQNQFPPGMSQMGSGSQPKWGSGSNQMPPGMSQMGSGSNGFPPMGSGSQPQWPGGSGSQPHYPGGSGSMPGYMTQAPPYAPQPGATTNPDTQILNDISASLQPKSPLPAAPGCPTQMQNGQLETAISAIMKRMTDAQAVTWFQNNYSASHYNNKFDGNCLINYWNPIHAFTTPHNCMQQGGGGGGSGGGYPPMGGSGSNHYPPMGGSGSQQHQYPPMSQMGSGSKNQYPPMSQMGSGSNGGGFPPMGGSGSNGGGFPPMGGSGSFGARQAQVQGSSGNSWDMSNSEPSGSHGGMDSIPGASQFGPPPGPSQHGSGTGSDPMHSQQSQGSQSSLNWGSSFNSNSHNSDSTFTHPPQATTQPACVPFGSDAACVMANRRLKRVLALRTLQANFPGCFCTNDCPSATSITYPNHQYTPAPSNQGTPVPSGQHTPSPSNQGTPVPSGQQTPSPSNQGTPVPSGQQTPSPSGQSTPVPSGQQTPSPSGQSTPVPSGQQTPSPSGQSTPVPSGQQTPSPSGQSTPVPSGQATTPVPAGQQVGTTVAGGTTQPPGTGGNGQQPTTTTAQPVTPQQQTSTVAASTTTTVEPTTGDGTGKTVTATIFDASKFNADNLRTALAEKYSVPKSMIEVNQINSTTVEITFGGANAESFAADFESNTTFAQAHGLRDMVRSNNAADASKGDAEDGGSSKLPMLIGIAVGAVAVLGVIAYLIHRNRKNKGTGGNQQFNMDYSPDDEAFLGQFENSMSGHELGKVEV